MRYILFVIPHENWIKKHGRVYCSICKDRSKIAKVPTGIKSVTYRKDHACCDNCKEVVLKKIENQDKWDSLDQSEAEYQLLGSNY